MTDEEALAEIAAAAKRKAARDWTPEQAARFEAGRRRIRERLVRLGITDDEGGRSEDTA